MRVTQNPSRIRNVTRVGDMTNVWTTCPIPPDFPPRTHNTVRRCGRPDFGGRGRSARVREGYFHFVDSTKPTMMKPNPMPTFTRPLACPPIEFITGICEPAT